MIPATLFGGLFAGPLTPVHPIVSKPTSASHPLTPWALGSRLRDLMETRAGVVVLRGHRELYERTWHLFANAREINCAANDVRTWASYNQAPPPPGKPVKTRRLYRPGVLLDPTGAQHARHVAAAGAHVRIITEELTELIIVDRRVAILAGEGTFSVVWIPGVVQGVLELYDKAWQAGTELADYERDFGDLCAVAPRILELLGSGAKDESAARTMGLSLRVYRRRVDDLVTTLGASSRFQAGARARELGLI
ncbi:MAG: DNA-binding response regulator [Kibdelosporangium sp.]